MKKINTNKLLWVIFSVTTIALMIPSSIIYGIKKSKEPINHIISSMTYTNLNEYSKLETSMEEVLPYDFDSIYVRDNFQITFNKEGEVLGMSSSLYHRDENTLFSLQLNKYYDTGEIMLSEVREENYSIQENSCLLKDALDSISLFTLDQTIDKYVFTTGLFTNEIKENSCLYENNMLHETNEKIEGNFVRYDLFKYNEGLVKSIYLERKLPE